MNRMPLVYALFRSQFKHSAALNYRTRAAGGDFLYCTVCSSLTGRAASISSVVAVKAPCLSHVCPSHTTLQINELFKRSLLFMLIV